jgi:hypothetical protein
VIHYFNTVNFKKNLGEDRCFYWYKYSRPSYRGAGSPGHGAVSDTRGFLIMVADSDKLHPWHLRTLFSLSLTGSVSLYPQECRRYVRSYL